MRVALFFDGKNFYENLERARSGRHHLNYRALAQWLVDRVGGGRMTGAHYYTGVPDQLVPSLPEYPQLRGLIRFLDNLEYVEGFFVYRFPRIKRISRCPVCSEYTSYTEEKEVDTTMVADMIRLAARDAFDTLVLASGDADHAPAVEAVREMGKVVYLASWGDEALSPRLRRAAFGHIDLLRECPAEILGDEIVARDAEGDEDAQAAQAPSVPEVSADMAERVLVEVARAQRYFEEHGDYLGRGYFIHRWRGRDIPSDVELREAVLDRLIELEKLEEVQILGETSLRAVTDQKGEEVEDVEEKPAATPLAAAPATAPRVNPPLKVARSIHDMETLTDQPAVVEDKKHSLWLRQTLEQHVQPDDELHTAWKSLKRAEEHFRHRGFVGRGYFLTKWRDVELSSDVGRRERVLTRLIELGLVEQYTVEGTTALRTIAG